MSMPVASSNRSSSGSTISSSRPEYTVRVPSPDAPSSPSSPPQPVRASASTNSSTTFFICTSLWIERKANLTQRVRVPLREHADRLAVRRDDDARAGRDELGRRPLGDDLRAVGEPHAVEDVVAAELAADHLGRSPRVGAQLQELGPDQHVDLRGAVSPHNREPSEQRLDEVTFDASPQE